MLPAPPQAFPYGWNTSTWRKHGTVYTLTGAVKINYQQYILLADKIVYDQNTGDANAEGHVSLDGRPR